MLGLTMETPLLTTDILRYAAIAHGETEIVSRNVDRSIYRYSYSAAKDRCLRLSATLQSGAVDWRPPRIARLEYP